MNFQAFTDLIQSVPDPVIIIEGRRKIPKELADAARGLASQLAIQFPQLKFRSGNADGADEAFTAGVLEVDPSRLQIIAPYASHRKRHRHPDAHYESPESLSQEELEEIKALSIAATPKNKGLIGCYGKGGRLASQAACLIRDTMKVAGIKDKLAPPILGLFCIDPENPDAGGTGHTIRACKNLGIPVTFQAEWENWLP